MTWEITRDKLFSKEERNHLVKATEEKPIVDLQKGRSTWVRRWMLVDLALFSGLRVSEIANLKIGDLHLNRKQNHIILQSVERERYKEVYYHDNDPNKPETIDWKDDYQIVPCWTDENRFIM